MFNRDDLSGVTMKRTVSLTLAGILMAVSTPAYVHHSGAMFDRDKEITLTGTISEFAWMNPHSSFKVNVTDPKGNIQVWAIEMNGPNNMVRLGWKRTTIKTGDKVTVTINPLRDGQFGGWYRGIKLPDGKTLSSDPPQA
jgi:hypothetical protein